MAAVVALAAPGAAGAATITEFSAGITPGGAPWGIVTGPDGNLWFTQRGADRVGRITPAGVVTEFSAGITPGSGPRGIAAGPDGNLWFAEPDRNRVARITPAGVVTEFSAGITPGSSPSWIVAGPDGNLWFTEFTANRVGRITPAGVVTEFSAGITPGSGPRGIAAGPDGNLWFAESADRVARITPAGVVTEFSAGISPGSQPWEIATGPDGNLWFTERDADRVARITPAGIVTEFSAGISPGAGLRGVAAGPDGNLWFTEERGNRVARITPAGLVTEFAGLSLGAGPRGIAAGPDGTVWFTEERGHRVARITIVASLPPPALGLTVNVQAVRGTVQVSEPQGAARAAGAHASQKGLPFVPLSEPRQIAVGSFLDTRRGTVDLASATGTGGRTQSGQFSAGIFQVLQSGKRRARGLTELRLKGSSFNRCRSGRGASAAQLSQRTIRRLRANTRGRFRTRGRHSAATVRGTTWVTADRCDGTLTTVKRGRVAVRDFRRKRTITLWAGKSYLARAPR